MDDDIALGYAHFKQQLAVRVLRRQLGLPLDQQEAMALLVDDTSCRAAYDAWRVRTGRDIDRATAHTSTTPQAPNVVAAPQASSVVAAPQASSVVAAPQASSATASSGCLAFLCLAIGFGLLLWGWPAAAGHTKTVGYNCSTTGFGATRCLNSTTTWIADGYSISTICVAILGGLTMLFGLIVIAQMRSGRNRR